MIASNTDRTIAAAAADLRNARWHRNPAALSIDCTNNNNNNETTSTSTAATAGTDRSSSQLESSNYNGQQQQQQPLESVMMHTRTNFGDYQTYVPPVTKSYPYSVPVGAPATTPKRVLLATPRRLSREKRHITPPTLPCSPERTPQDDDSLMDRSPIPASAAALHHDSLRAVAAQVVSESPHHHQQQQRRSHQPLDAKRLEFFDDAATGSVYEDEASLLPFDQVWNQQELCSLSPEEEEEEPTGPTPTIYTTLSGRQQKLGEAPFDEAPAPADEEEEEEEAPMEVSMGSSAYSAFSSTSTTLPPPPPPLTPRQKARLIIERSDSLRMTPKDPPISRNGDPPEIREHVSTEEEEPQEGPGAGAGDDIPSDEDETKRNGQPTHQQLTTRDGRNKQHVSLATASKRTTAEDVGQLTGLKSSTNATHRGKRDDEYHDDHDDGEEDHTETVEGDEDSLFDFKEQRSMSPNNKGDHGVWRRGHDVRGHLSSDDEEMSLEDGQKRPCLKTRAQEAFASRRRFSPRKGTSPARPSSPRSPPRGPLPATGTAAADTNTAKPKAQVSFGATNTIHHFEHEDDMYSDQEESVLSVENEKTIGSDVEDAIRDIFMINTLGACIPSPRQRRIRYHSDTRNEQREAEHSNYSYEEEDDDDDEDTLRSYEEPTTTSRSKPATTKGGEETKEAPQNDDVFFESMMSMVEGGIGAMSAAFGFAPSTDAAAEEAKSNSSGTKAAAPSSPSRSKTSSMSSAPRSSPAKTSPPRSPPNKKKMQRLVDSVESANSGVVDSMSDYKSPTNKKKMQRLDSVESTNSGVFDSMSDYISPPNKKKMQRLDSAESAYSGVSDFVSDYMVGPEKSESSEKLELAPSQEVEYEDQLQIVAHEEDEPQSLEDDPRILELAKQAALCMHEVQGAKYDESREVDIVDIKFAVVELSLPLGIIFQEDYSGCWVAKVMPKGNAYLSGDVEPGDQLAAIHGKSSIGMKVDDICAAITDPEDEDEAETIKLTFLRYIGPFQPVPGDVHIDTTAKEMVFEDEESIYTYPREGEGVIMEDERPRSTISITNRGDSKLSTKKAEQPPASPKRGRKKFKWFKKGKKNATKAE